MIVIKIKILLYWRTLDYSKFDAENLWPKQNYIKQVGERYESRNSQTPWSQDPFSVLENYWGLQRTFVMWVLAIGLLYEKLQC